MEFKKINIKDLKPASYNPRKKLKPGDKEYEKIKKSIQEFGYVEPIIVNNDMSVIGGHQRISVLSELGYTEIECIVIDIDKAKEKALNVALNKISGQWDIPLLRDLISDLNKQQFDTTITGFDAGEIEEMMAKNSPAEIEDLLKELSTENIITKPIWATIRTSEDKKDQLEKALRILENSGIGVERSYDEHRITQHAE